MIKTVDLVGIALYMFVKSSLVDKIKYLDHSIVKTGLLGATGNKGSVFIRFNYYNTSFAISCGHLSAGNKHNKSRISELTDIINKGLKNHEKEEIKVKNHDIFIIYGDVNFRVDLEYEVAKEILEKKGSLQPLIENEQFSLEKKVNTNLMCLEEGPLSFNPTYKYDTGTSIYTTKKMRTPSW